MTGRTGMAHNHIPALGTKSNETDTGSAAGLPRVRHLGRCQSDSLDSTEWTLPSIVSGLSRRSSILTMV